MDQNLWSYGLVWTPPPHIFGFSPPLPPSLAGFPPSAPRMPGQLQGFCAGAFFPPPPPGGGAGGKTLVLATSFKMNPQEAFEAMAFQPEFFGWRRGVGGWIFELGWRGEKKGVFVWAPWVPWEDFFFGGGVGESKPGEMGGVDILLGW